MLLALSLVFAFASGCKEQPPPAPAGDPAEQPAPAAVDKPAAAEALAAPGLPAPAATEASPAATSSPSPAAPAAATARSEPDKHTGGSNATAPSLLGSPQATATSTATAAAPPVPAPAASVAQKAEPPAVEVMSPKVTEAAFNLWMQSSGRYKAGQQGQVEIVLVPKGDYHCNEQYPYKFGSSGFLMCT